jgi:hypothetical protein
LLPVVCCRTVLTVIQSLYCVCFDIVLASLNKHMYFQFPNNHRSLRYHNSIPIRTALPVFSTSSRASLDPTQSLSYGFRGLFARSKAVWARA